MKRILILLAVFFLTAGSLLSDSIYLKNGDFIKGKVISQDDRKMTIKTDAGIMDILKKDIKNFQYESAESSKNFQLPEKSFLRLEGGFTFPTYSSLNTGIKGEESGIKTAYSPDADDLVFKNLNFESHLFIKAGTRLLSGSIGRRLMFFLNAGYAKASSLNTVRFTDSILQYDYSVTIFPIELGAEISFATLQIFNKNLDLSIGLGFGTYIASMVLDFRGSASSSDLYRFPSKYSGIGFGFTATFSAHYRFTDNFGVVLTGYYRMASINKLQGNIIQADGFTSKETLYIDGGNFASSSSPVTGASAATVDLSGPGVFLGIQWSFGEKRLTDIPRGFYR